MKTGIKILLLFGAFFAPLFATVMTSNWYSGHTMILTISVDKQEYIYTGIGGSFTHFYSNYETQQYRLSYTDTLVLNDYYESWDSGEGYGYMSVESTYIYRVSNISWEDDPTTPDFYPGELPPEALPPPSSPPTLNVTFCDSSVSQGGTLHLTGSTFDPDGYVTVLNIGLWDPASDIYYHVQVLPGAAGWSGSSFDLSIDLNTFIEHHKSPPYAYTRGVSPPPGTYNPIYIGVQDNNGYQAEVDLGPITVTAP